MKKSIVFINKNSFILNGEEYDFDKISEIGHLIKSNLKIIILEENLYIKQFKNNFKRRNIYKFIDYKIKSDFPQTGDLLYDYEINKKNIAIYSIKGGLRLEKFIEEAKTLEIKPIQFIIKEIMLKFLKKSDFKAKVLTKFYNCYYFIYFNEGLFNFGVVDGDKGVILNSIIESSKDEEIYADDFISDAISDDLLCNNRIKVIKLNLGELINEKIYEKQKFHSRKIS